MHNHKSYSGFSSNVVQEPTKKNWWQKIVHFFVARLSNTVHIKDMDITHYISNPLPKHDSIEHLMNLEQECSELEVRDYNRFAMKVAGQWEEPNATVPARKVK